jgi:hypothetical protein
MDNLDDHTRLVNAYVNGLDWSGLQEYWAWAYDERGGKMTKKHYKLFATACQLIEAGISEDVPDPMVRKAVMETVIAQIGIVCATDNSKFDSFQFAECARRGEIAKREITAR